jgi:hypothetical protein
MQLQTAFDVDVGYAAGKTPLTVTISLDAPEQDVELIKEMMVRAFAQTETVSDAVMRTLLASSYRETKSPTHRYIQWTRVHEQPNEMYPSRLMSNIQSQKAARM